MFKKLLVLAVVGLISINVCGCTVVSAIVSEYSKAKQDLDVSYVKALDIVKEMFSVTGMKLKKAVIESNSARVTGIYIDGRTVRINIFKVSDDKCSIEVRVGMTEAGKKDAQKIMKAITDIESASPTQPQQPKDSADK